MKKLEVGSVRASFSLGTCPVSASLVLDNVTSPSLVHQQFKQEEMEGPSILSQLVLKSHLFIF